MQTNRVYLPDIVGKGYGAFWRFKGRYKVVKGSRASKKSSTQSLKVIIEIMENPCINWLVVQMGYAPVESGAVLQMFRIAT